MRDVCTLGYMSAYACVGFFLSHHNKPLAVGAVCVALLFDIAAYKLNSKVEKEKEEDAATAAGSK